ncbi:inositol-3-phosphate synthase [Natronorubrum daqingense]|uniref:Myo-inositol-1-phosphate synthase n=1 Tax=Natronorubrum daqingense TaxID=588898 RepID=A0A1N7G8M7_9EURY|nr:inositol-3-phosphate synthase [Natronorubrum daqingense]APX97285.1 myo-inositol-1-phosphate synthase [Natronorubrum daqingense]SIS08940.1 myo-inositol-1-phosphate synthase [Natronorubrum daqingense]
MSASTPPEPPETDERLGVWLVGARGNVATTAIVGARAIARGLTGTTGMVTERDPVSRLELPPVSGFVFGGHDIERESLREQAARQSERNGVPDGEMLSAVEDDLDRIDERIEVGTARNCGAAVSAESQHLDPELTVGSVVEQIRSDYRAFREEHGLERLVVVNVASTEPELDDADGYNDREALERAIDEDDADLPASVLYAYAAVVDGHPFVNFTPSTGNALGGVQELAVEENVPHMGRDAKTGETLVKSALAPMFAGRNLQVLAWEGHNILGNKDGLVLEDEANAAGKLSSKGELLESILPDIGHNRVRIDYTPSLADWKTAWDYIHFEGFLDTEMKMQFTWEGSDSALAAPLVLDLVRLIAHADEHDEGGLQPQLSSFFKAPLGVDEHDFSRQLEGLAEYAERHR